MLYAARSLGLRQVAMMRDLRANDKVLQAFALNPVASQHGTFDYGGTWRELYLLFRTIVAADGINSCVDVTENAWRTFKLRRRALSLTAAAHV